MKRVRTNRPRTPRPALRGEPGMAMMLVLLIIVIVSGAGVFAARATAMEVRSSGYVRQSAQTHYIAESGVLASMDELRQYCAAYTQQMQARSRTLTTPVGLAEPPMQYEFRMEDFVNRTATAGLFKNATQSGTTRTEGSLGTSALVPGFTTTATLVGVNGQPMVGFSVGGGRDLTIPMATIEFASDGSTRLSGVTDTKNSTVGAESARVIAQLPCL